MYRIMQKPYTVEPQYNEGPRDRKNLFAITRCFLLYFTIHWGKENRSLYRGHSYIEVRYIKVPL